MGLLTIFLFGDFKQTLPFVSKGAVADEFKACLKSPSIWPKVQASNLTIDMRCHLYPAHLSEHFSADILGIDEDNVPVDPNGELNP